MTEEPQPEQGQEDKPTWENFKKKEIAPGLYRFGVFSLSALLLVLSNGVVFLVGLAFKAMGTTFPKEVTNLVGWITVGIWVLFNVGSALSDMRGILSGFFADIREIWRSLRTGTRH